MILHTIISEYDIMYAQDNEKNKSQSSQFFSTNPYKYIGMCRIQQSEVTQNKNEEE